MATKYPTAIDDAVTLGGPFIDTAPPVDPQRNIAAEFRNNLNDATLAIERRLGILGSTDPITVDWGLLTVSGDPNQGVRFENAHVAWPGLIAESGIFVATGTGNVSYHKAGDPLAIFTDLTSGGGISSWNDLYATGTQMDVTGTSMDFVGNSANDVFRVAQTGAGDVLEFWEGAIGGAAANRRMHVRSDSQVHFGVNNASKGVTVGQYAAGAIFTCRQDDVESGTIRFEVPRTGAAFVTAASPSDWGFTVQQDDALGDLLLLKSGVNSRFDVRREGNIYITPESPTGPFNTLNVTLQSGGIGINTAIGANIVVNSAVGDTNANLYGARLTFNDVGGTHNSYGLYIPSGWDYGIRSEAPVYAGAQLTASVTSAAAGSAVDFNETTTNAYVMTLRRGGVPHTTFDYYGAINIASSTAGTSFYLDHTGTGTNIMELRDGGVRRLTVTQSGTATIETTGGAACVEMVQGTATGEVFEVTGTIGADYTRTISNVQGDGSLTGPLNRSAQDGWKFANLMMKVVVNGTPYALPLYEGDFIP